ncbi:MAG: hypothetical protein J6Y01_00815 [Spirochaetales bacterium]|nr:hypothetical protein [Spirochaetales bacterium]
MTNKSVINTLDNIRLYCSAEHLDILEYAIEVFQKLDKDGVEKPLETDFTVLTKGDK